MAAVLKELKVKKANLKRQLTKFINFVTTLESQDIPENKIAQLTIKLQSIEPSLAAFNENQCKIECLESAENQVTIEDETDKFETDYFDAVSRARILLDKHNVNISHNQSKSSNETLPLTIQESSRAIQLPTIKIPQFDGSYDTWFTFHDTYKSLIHSNETLAPIQKFHYLRSSLTGEAAIVIQALEITQKNYSIAWQLLVDRYDNKKLTIQKHVNALFSMPSVCRESASDIRNLIDSVQKHLRALEALGEPTIHWDTLVIHLITSKCDKHTLKEWETQSQKSEKPLLKNLITFLNNKCQILEVVNKEPFPSNKAVPAKIKSVNLVAQTGSCPQCKGKHNLYQCEQFIKMSSDERRILAKKLKDFADIVRRSTTHYCATAKDDMHINEPTNVVKESTSSKPSCAVVSTPSLDTLKQTLLSTAHVKVIDHAGHLHSARVLLDPASHCNFMTEAFSRRLKCRTKPISIPISGIGQQETQTNHITTVVIKSSYNAYKRQLEFLVLPQITENLPTEDFDDTAWNIPKTIKLADKMYNKSAPVDLLIGAEIFWELLCVGQIKLGPNLPLLHKTRLGWIVGGPLPWYQTKTKQACNLSLQQVSNQMKQFWEIEENLASKPLLSTEENACVEIFEKTTVRDDDGKFTIRLPLKSDKTTLGSSEDTALKRFYQLERKLSQNESLRKSYTEFMQEYLELKHMQETTTQDTCSNDEITYFIPHHAVTKSTSLTTKTRVVFDASAKTDNGVSLNDIMLVGPQLQPELFNIIIQFRTHKIGLIADIEKMYRMIWVHPEDRGLQQIFWRNSPDETVKTYQLCTLTYGTAAASFIATKALCEVAEREKETHPALENIIKRCFYMDDLISGTETVIEALELKEKLDKALRAYGFKLRKWCSNNEEVRKSLNQNGDEFEIIDISRENTIKTLGLTWNPCNDFFQYSVKDDIKEERITKRNILSNIARIFDPLGLIGPILIIAKLILQQLWQEGLEWDETPSTSTYTQWNQFRNQLAELNDLHINRNVMPIRNPNIIQFHGFCDASEQAYGACLYVRTMNDSETSCHLLCSKGRVAPLKRISLPRLELCGALLLSQLYNKVITHLDLQCEIFLWTDSTIVLSWLHGQPNQWQAFVGNRVSQIQTATNIADWRHVRSSENPADILSRGLNPNQLKQKSLWWHGSSWLAESTTSWPIYRNEVTELPEKRNIKLLGMVTTVTDTSILEKYSNFIKLRRVIAYILRFIHNIKNKENKRISNLIVEELNQAEIAIVKFVQRQIYHKEINDINLHGTINNSRPLCPLSNDPNDINPLTPGHFLTGDSLMAIPEPELRGIPINRLSRWQHVQQMYQHFWRRCSLEYLNQLQERTKWKKKGNIQFAIGDLVLIKDENLPPLKWQLGRIIRLHPGKDGEVRVFDVKTKSGEVKRSITKLCQLPIEGEVISN